MNVKAFRSIPGSSPRKFEQFATITTTGRPNKDDVILIDGKMHIVVSVYNLEEGFSIVAGTISEENLGGIV